ncbi:hypothetical protein V8C34DRAFT_16675 [Trichoderma compactum]
MACVAFPLIIHGCLARDFQVEHPAPMGLLGPFQASPRALIREVPAAIPSYEATEVCALVTDLPCRCSRSHM